MEKPSEPQFQIFEQWCEAEAIDMTVEDNWEHFWDTWNEGFKAGRAWTPGEADGL